MRGTGILLTQSLNLDIKVVTDGSGKIVSGLQVGNTLYQNQALILIFSPGAVKTAPVVGVGIDNIILDTDFLGMRRTIRRQMELDRQTIRKISFSNTEQLAIDGEYSNS